MRRGVVAMLAAAAVACGGARAEPGLIVGLADDTLMATPVETSNAGRDLGVRAYSLSLDWQRGRLGLSAASAGMIQTAVNAAGGNRVVLWVYGPPFYAPTTAGDREQYCTYLRDAVTRFPQIRDVVIWNEPNLSSFWTPQFNPDGTSAAPAAYVSLLARCWDVLHAFRPGVNVIAPATSPWGNDDPGAASNVSHSPTRFLLELGAAYRASGRDKPIFDTLGHHPYPASSAERPWRTHTSDQLISIGDLDRLVGAAEQAFGGTGQTAPGSGLPIWYLETGYQTVPDPSKAGLYTGTENWPGSLPDAAGGEPAQPPPSPDSLAPDQATQLVDSLRLAYCQPHVQAVFNFQLRDEPSLERWQSGLLWADGTRKGSYEAFKRVVAEINNRSVDCTRLKGMTFAELIAAGGAGKAGQRGGKTLAGADARKSTRIAWTARNPARFGFARFAARLASPGEGRLRSRSVTFTLLRQVYLATTRRTGVASTTVSPPLRPGAHVVTATFRGDAGHRPASVKVLLRVVNSRAVVSAHAPTRAPASAGDQLSVRFDGRAVSGALRVRAGDRVVRSARLTALGVSPNRRTAWFSGRSVTGVSLLGKIELGSPGRKDELRLWLNGRQLRTVKTLDLRIGRPR
ncbi:MAG TPA: hypothetical protein VFR43_00180 [Gaiellaceae bacterium]|nr:hypothetical protein [Gaiellaceae bacterium]